METLEDDLMPTVPKLTLTPAMVTAAPGDLIENIVATAVGSGNLVVTFDGTTDLGEPISGDFTIDRSHLYELDWRWDPDKNDGKGQPAGLIVTITPTPEVVNEWDIAVQVP